MTGIWFLKKIKSLIIKSQIIAPPIDSRMEEEEEEGVRSKKRSLNQQEGKKKSEKS